MNSDCRTYLIYLEIKFLQYESVSSSYLCYLLLNRGLLPCKKKCCNRDCFCVLVNTFILILNVSLGVYSKNTILLENRLCLC